MHSHPHEPTPSWKNPDVAAALTRWVVSEAESLGFVLLEDFTLSRERPWSGVFRAESSVGGLWVKANTRALRGEARLMAHVQQCPLSSMVWPVLAVEVSQGWVLSGDVSPSLVDHLSGCPQSRGEWLVSLAQSHAHFQRASVYERKDILSEGAWPLLPAKATDYVAQCVSSLAALPAGAKHHVSLDEAREMSRALPDLAVAMEALASSSLPHVLMHGDPSLSNAYVVDPEGAAPPLPSDWVAGRDEPQLLLGDFADAVWSHPLALLPLMEQRTRASDEEARAMRAAFCEVWSDTISVEEVLALLPAASSLAALHQYSLYARIDSDLGEGSHELVPALPLLLRQVLLPPH